MANSILIRFPISTHEFEITYMLGLEMDWSQKIENAIRDDGCFVEKPSNNNYYMIFEGTLNGDTIVQTDKRESIYDPLISSKLKFNLVSHNFPAWLIEETDYYTDVRCVLAILKNHDWEEQWRGYVWGNTLNSRVVDDYIVTPIFAIDEVGMAKYLKVHNTIGENGKTRRLWNYFTYYKTLNDSYFGHAYQAMEIVYSSDEIVWDSPVCIHYDGREEPDLLKSLYFDSYGYVFQDKDEDKKTWKDLFFDVCQYLNITFMVGGHGSAMFNSRGNANDSYLLETPDPATQTNGYTRIVHTVDNVTETLTSTNGMWTTISPGYKCNADFNITLEPAKYKGVRVKSEVKRYEAHEYLSDENMKYYVWDKSKYVLHRWGTTGHGSSTAYCVNSPKFHKLYYMEPDTKENQYISASTYNITTGNNYNAAYLLNFGYIQADMNAQNYTWIKSADTLSYILTKMGATFIKMGEFDVQDTDGTEDENLENYILLMNHKWNNCAWLDDSLNALHNTAAYALTGNEYEAVRFKPFGDHEIRHNNEPHWLKIDYDLIVCNENIGNLDRLTDVSPYHVADMRGSEALAMPTTKSVYDYDNESKTYGSNVGNYFDGDEIQGYPPMMRWEAKIGQYELTDRGPWVTTANTAATRGINISHFPDNYETSIYASNQAGMGYKFCPYYNTLHPRSRGGKNDAMFEVFKYGGNGAPVNGVLEMKIKAPAICFDWKGGKVGYLNNIYYLLNNFKFSFTDEAEILNKPTEYETTDIYDTLSKTKVIDEINYNLSTPQYDGLFYNCFQCVDPNNIKAISNARNFYKQGSHTNRTMEEIGREAMCMYLAPSPMKVEFTMHFEPHSSNNMLWNNHVFIEYLTETDYKFEVKEKTIYINKDMVKFNADRVFDDPWAKMPVAPNNPKHATLPVEDEYVEEFNEELIEDEED